LLLWKVTPLPAVAAISAAAIVVFVFAALRTATAMFNHAKGRLPVAGDRWLRHLH